jgi:threonine dehydrogenase-like Zn-dependent dehydrogenase
MTIAAGVGLGVAAVYIVRAQRLSVFWSVAMRANCWIGTKTVEVHMIRAGQTHVHRYMRPLLGRITRGEIDPRFVITHHLSLNDAPKGFAMFKEKQDDCLKVVLKTAA